MNNFEILILTKKKTYYVALLQGFFEKQNIISKVILDDKPVKERKNYLYYDDNEVSKAGFTNLNFEIPKDPSAWPKSLYHLKHHMTCDYCWIIEEDVFCKDLNLFLELFEKASERDVDLIASHIFYKDEVPEWPHWEDSKFFNSSRKLRSLNCLCRLSKKLVGEILSFREEHGSFVFLETLFSGICEERNLSYLDFLQDASLKDFFYKFRWEWRPPLSAGVDRVQSNKISHPVKFTDKVITFSMKGKNMNEESKNKPTMSEDAKKFYELAKQYGFCSPDCDCEEGICKNS